MRAHAHTFTHQSAQPKPSKQVSKAVWPKAYAPSYKKEERSNTRGHLPWLSDHHFGEPLNHDRHAWQNSPRELSAFAAH